MKILEKLNIIGDITYDSYLQFVGELDKLKNKPLGIVFVELSSEGGDAYAALAFYDKIRACKHDITIMSRGLVASAAIIILAAGDKRLSSPSTWFMMHEDEVPLNENARVTEVEKDVKHARRLEHQWNLILENRTGVNSKIWAELHKNETYLTAAEALKYNLITGIL